MGLYVSYGHYCQGILDNANSSHTIDFLEIFIFSIHGVFLIICQCGYCELVLLIQGLINLVVSIHHFPMSINVLYMY